MDSYVLYIFSDGEIQTLLACADNWADRHIASGIRMLDVEFCMLLRMPLGCGFRLGEVLAARVGDVNFPRGTILVRHAKNNKQRIVPMDGTLTGMLEKYCIAMAIRAEPGKWLFPSARKEGATSTQSAFRRRFKNLLSDELANIIVVFTVLAISVIK